MARYVLSCIEAENAFLAKAALHLTEHEEKFGNSSGGDPEFGHKNKVRWTISVGRVQNGTATGLSVNAF